MSLRDIVFIYMGVMSLVLFIVMGVDKRRALKQQWRVPEATLLGLAAIGGSVGGILGMFVFRHKIRKPKFFIGFPLILIVHGVLIWWLFFR